MSYMLATSENYFGTGASTLGPLTYPGSTGQFHDIESYTDALNQNVNGQTWDDRSQLLTEIHADGGVVTHSYDAFGNQVKLTDAMGYVTLYGYDVFGRNNSITNPNMEVYSVLTDQATSTIKDLTTNMIYDQAGRKLQQTDGAGNVTRYTFDLAGNVIATTDADGYVTTGAFNAFGNKVAAVDANGKLSTWNYDGFGQLQGRTDIGGADAQGFDSLLITSGIHRDELHRWTWLWEPKLGGIEVTGSAGLVKASSFCWLRVSTGSSARLGAGAAACGAASRSRIEVLAQSGSVRNHSLHNPQLRESFHASRHWSRNNCAIAAPYSRRCWRG